MKIIISIGDCNGIGIEAMLKAIEKFDSESVYAQSTEISISGRLDVILDYAAKMNINVVGNKDLGIGNWELENGIQETVNRMQEVENEVNELYFKNISSTNSLTPNPGPRTPNSQSGIFIMHRFCPVIECPAKAVVDFGKISLDAGKLSAEAIELAVSKTIAGEFDAIVTMPVAKSSLYLAGWKYPGHTEMLASACNIKKYMMILCTRDIRVALVTIHIPLKDVASSISVGLIEEKIRIFNDSIIKDYGIKNPKIAVLGLNPHAGEDGSIGTEEIEIISPAISKMINNGINVSGPHPSDGFFAHGDYKNYDGILSIYHDQGLIPLKLLACGGGVNYTAGLPIIRTSPDHGTAFAIAGKGLANPQSTYDALEMAVEVFKQRNCLIL